MATTDAWTVDVHDEGKYKAIPMNVSVPTTGLSELGRTLIFTPKTLNIYTLPKRKARLALHTTACICTAHSACSSQRWYYCAYMPHCDPTYHTMRVCLWYVLRARIIMATWHVVDADNEQE